MHKMVLWKPVATPPTLLQGKPNFELIRHDVVEPILLEASGQRHRLSPNHYSSRPCGLLTERFIPRAG